MGWITAGCSFSWYDAVIGIEMQVRCCRAGVVLLLLICALRSGRVVRFALTSRSLARHR